jgi:AcrR family transcriptional regulator
VNRVLGAGDDGTEEAERGTTPERPRRVTRRRVQTRDRLLDAALEVFAERGFGRSSVEHVCSRAGYSRGAFYSNFESLDALFLAMWQRRSEQMLADIREAAKRDSGSESFEDSARHVLAAIPVDDQWFRVDAEFTAHALRAPSVRAAVAAQESAILTTIAEIVENVTRRGGRRLTADPYEVGRALVAVHDGTSAQCLLEPEDDSVWARRTDLFLRVLLSYSEPASDQNDRA